MERQFGRYVLLERLGAGGMAEVWKAKSFGALGFEKTLALKRILPELAREPELLEMFVHEAKLSVRLSHANIVQVFDLGFVEQEGEPPGYYIAMEYVAGLDLATLLARFRRTKTRLPFGMAVFVAAEVAKALDHAHRRRDEQGKPLGIVHRDVSPQNILVSWEGEVKVTDFGIAKAKGFMREDEHAGESVLRVRGKLSYMSPEQSLAQPLDGRSDLFSLGTVLYELVAGTNPFAGAGDAETLRRVRAAEAPPLELARSDVPRELAAIVRRLLTRRPEERVADAGRLHEQLLGYFYATGDRFGSNDLAELVAPFHDDARKGPEIEAGSVLGDPQGTEQERTPVEVPTTSASLKVAAENVATANFFEPVGERREGTVLVVAGTCRIPALPFDVEGAREVITRYGGVILEQEPSQVVALFGLEDADGRDTEAAVRAALVILRAQKGRGASAGVHVGRVLVDARGVPIVDARLGTLVTQAQGLARAVAEQVAASHPAARIVRGAFGFDELPDGAGSVPEGGRVITSARPPIGTSGKFVGRQEELRRIGEILAAATRKRAQVITILGEKGIGKTRLCAEIERRLGRGNWSVGFYAASCPPSGAELPWSGLQAMLQVLCGVQEGDGEQAILATLPRLRALGLQEEESSAVLRQLGARIGDRPSRHVGGMGTALRAAFTRMVHKLCEDRIHCFAWDDAQAMDAATAEAIASVASRNEGAASAIRAVFLLATRTAPPSVLLPLARHHVVALGPLGGEESERLVAERIGVRAAPRELAAFCRERAAGHPLFIEELLKELVDARAVEVEDGRVRLRLDGARAVPRALRTLMEARVSRLPQRERGALNAAAILGDPVHTQVLAALLGESFSVVDRGIGELVARGFLRSAGPAEVSFPSPMHGEIVLDTIPHEARRDLHGKAADAYRAVFGDEVAEAHGERVGTHLYHAGDRDRAATFYARAASHRVRLCQLEPGIRLLLRAIDLADLDRRPATEIASWLRELCSAVLPVRAAPSLEDLSARALRRIDAAGTLEQRVAARVDVARALGAVNRFDRAYVEIDLAFKLAAQNEELQRRALVAEIDLGARSGDFARAARAADRLEAMGPAEDPRTLLAIAHVRAATGVAAAALLAIDRAEAKSPSGDPTLASEREKERVLVYAFMRDFRAASEASARAVELARAAGLRAEMAASLHNLGDTTRRLGDFPRAYATLTESLQIAEEAGYERIASLNRVHLAYLDGQSGKPGAEVRIRELVKYAEARGYHADALEGRSLLASLLAEHGARDEARRELELVLRMADAYGNGFIADDAREALAKLG
ncbi:serine/threonine-protein kinase [Polyangium mundeleinium]|uniref:Protein kinase n=1 Tax=Polyangium mundeleinium TaxID=2995306 RepID=A0ABT5F3S8_9BACT|nr:serine/threonine-protein kinase [Polyangium mundeleinium]MDC0748759.1 protein kinase [Polyangium mundeleinium]